jgi:quercetin dioxygenase-like cupin family protein
MATQDASSPSFVVKRRIEVKPSQPEPGLTRRILAYDDKLFVAEHGMDKGWAGALHSHPHEQVLYVVLGRVTLHCEGQSFELRPGDTFLVKGGVEHSATALEDSVVVDVFTPCREDFIAR